MVRNKLGTGGCATCRHRRIKCDETKPACRTCIAGNHTCGGYSLNNQLKFVVPRSNRLQAKKKENNLNRLDTSHAIKDMHICEVYRNVQQASPTRASVTTTDVAIPYPRRHLPAASREGMYIQRACYSLNKIYQMADQFVLPDSKTSIASYLNGRLRSFVELCEPVTIVRVIALALGAFDYSKRCREHDSSTFILESLKYYSLGLVRLRDALLSLNPSFESLIDMAYSILLFGLYEVEVGRFDAWKPHLLALGCILRKIGSKQCAASLDARVLYYYHAGQARLYQILDNVKCVLLSDEWLELYDLREHTFLLLRARAIRCIVHQDLIEGRQIYSALLALENECSPASDNAKRTSLYWLELLTLLTLVARLIGIEHHWSPQIFSYLVDRDGQLTIYDSFLALQVLSGCNLTSSDKRMWCLSKLRQLIAGKLSTLENGTPKLLQEVDQAILEIIMLSSQMPDAISRDFQPDHRYNTDEVRPVPNP